MSALMIKNIIILNTKIFLNCNKKVATEVMKYYTLGLLFFFTTILNTQAQTIDQDKLSAVLKEQAAKMGSAFISGDYKTFAKYNHPKILQIIGGEAKMAAALVKTVADMKSKGMSFKSITFGEPSAIVKSGKELQATISQHTEINTSPGRAISTSTIIAISTDNGINWTFMDTLNKDMATIKKMLPNLSPAITIPPQQPPVRYNL
jgi:hypothetical protein